MLSLRHVAKINCTPILLHPNGLRRGQKEKDFLLVCRVCDAVSHQTPVCECVSVCAGAVVGLCAGAGAVATRFVLF